MSVYIEVKRCGECPYMVVKRMYTEDSWETAFDWFCEKGDSKKIKGYIESSNEEPKEIPEWCPLRGREDSAGVIKGVKIMSEYTEKASQVVFHDVDCAAQNVAIAIDKLDGANLDCPDRTVYSKLVECLESLDLVGELLKDKRK